MDAPTYFGHIVESMKEPPLERHAALARLHTYALDAYLQALRRIDAGDAERPVQAGADQRTLVQVVGHIAAWHRFSILGAGDILAGIKNPRGIIGEHGYVETDGQRVDFDSVDHFNAYQAERHATWRWEPMRAWAEEMAMTLHAMFTQPKLITATRLEATAPYRKVLYDDVAIENTTLGWGLWLLMLEHLAIEHAKELGIRN